MASYKTNLSLHGAYRLNDVLLRDIFRNAAAFLDDAITIAISFSDEHRFESPNIDEALNDQLIRMHVITEISIAGSSYQTKPTRHFRFIARENIYLPTIEVDLEGDHDSCTALRSAIEDLIRPKLLWYWPLVPQSVWHINLAIWALTLLVFGASYGIYFALGNRAPSYWPLVYAVGWYPALFYLLALVRRLFFPQLIIELGRSASVGARVSTFHRLVFGSIVLAVIVGTISSLLANWISK